MDRQRTPLWVAGIVASILAASLAGCGGGDSGPAGPAGPTGPTGPTGPPGNPGTPGGGGTGTVNVGSNALTNPAAIQANAEAWADLQPTITVTGVTIASPPVVSFTVVDAFGNPVVGLGNTSQSSTATVASLPTLAFAIASSCRERPARRASG